MVRKIGRTNEQRPEKKVKILYIVFTKNKIEKREEAENTLKQKLKKNRKSLQQYTTDLSGYGALRTRASPLLKRKIEKNQAEREEFMPFLPSRKKEEEKQESL